METQFYDLPYGITTIDTGFVRPGFTASHLIVETGAAAFVDVGPASTLPALLDVLQQKQIPREQVRYVIVTHVHLDHSGGVGTLLPGLPNAQVVVHPKGARHLIAPEKLIAGATAVYGADVLRTLFGEILPVPEERVIEAAPERRLDLHGRTLICVDTPGHARHHLCLVDERSQGIFTGDTFGLSYREFDTDRGNFIFPATAPVQFEPEELHASINRLMTYQPTSLYLTHFGRVTDVPRLVGDLRAWIDQLVHLARSVNTSGQARHAELVRQVEHLLLARLQAHGCSLSHTAILNLLKTDVELNVQGLEVLLDRQNRKK